MTATDSTYCTYCSNNYSTLTDSSFAVTTTGWQSKLLCDEVAAETTSSGTDARSESVPIVISIETADDEDDRVWPIVESRGRRRLSVCCPFSQYGQSAYKT